MEGVLRELAAISLVKGTDKEIRISLSVSALVDLAIAKWLQSFLSLTVWMSTVPTLPIVRRNAHGYQAGDW